MIVASVYAIDTGEITAIYQLLNEDDIHSQLIDGQAYLLGRYNPEDFWINKDNAAEQRIDADLSIPEAINVGDVLTFEVPVDSYAMVNGIKTHGSVTIPSAEPTTYLIQIIGKYRGTYRLKVNGYVENRVAAYPSYGDQFDYIYHNGYEAWHQMITDIKNQYPKPS